MGHEVTIVAASFSHTRFRQPETKNSVNEEVIDGIRYLWIKCPEYNPSSKIGRIRNIFSFLIKTLCRRWQFSKIDIVISSSHYPLSIFPARKLSKAFGAKLVFEVRDLWPLTLIELGGMSSKHPFIFFMQWAEEYAYRTADKVVSVLPTADRYMQAHGMAPEKFLYIPNGADITHHDHESLEDISLKLIRDLKDNGCFLLGYSGRMGLANALNFLIVALSFIDDPRIHVVLLGEGYELQNLKQQTEQLDLVKRVHFLPFVPKTQVLSFLEEMDALYVGFLKQPIYRFGTSVTKMNDYMLAAKPVICSIDGNVEGVDEVGSGIFCRAEDPEDIAKAICLLSRVSVEERCRMGAAGREWVIANRDYRVLAERFLNGLGSCV